MTQAQLTIRGNSVITRQNNLVYSFSSNVVFEETIVHGISTDSLGLFSLLSTTLTLTNTYVHDIEVDPTYNMFQVSEHSTLNLDGTNVTNCIGKIITSTQSDVVIKGSRLWDLTTKTYLIFNARGYLRIENSYINDINMAEAPSNIKYVILARRTNGEIVGSTLERLPKDLFYTRISTWLFEDSIFRSSVYEANGPATQQCLNLEDITNAIVRNCTFESFNAVSSLRKDSNRPMELPSRSTTRPCRLTDPHSVTIMLASIQVLSTSRAQVQVCIS